MSLFNTEQYCPKCFKENNGELQMVYLDPEDPTNLICPKHGYVYEVNRSKNTYKEVGTTPVDPDPTPVVKNVIGEAVVGTMKVE